MVDVAADNTDMTKMEAWLATRGSKTYNPYYNGKMSFTLHGKDWDTYVAEAFPDLKDQATSENIFKGAIDLYAENLVPQPDQLRGFSNSVIPLLSRGECPVVVDSSGTPHFPEHYEMISDGNYTVACIFTRSIEAMEDYMTFAYSNGVTRLFSKPVPEDMTPATQDGFKFVETKTGATLLRFALDDKGFGAGLAALQDRVNHSIIDQTVIAEMYARPFWYLLNVAIPPKNPYLPQGSVQETEGLNEQKTKGAGRIFTTSGEGPFGQLTPPTIVDMINFHDSILDKVSQNTGIPQFYFKPGSGVPPTGVALKVLSKRFNNKIARMREDIEPQLEQLAELLGVDKTGTEKDPKTGADKPSYEFWNTSDDLLQEALDAHGIALSQMGYPLEYIAEVVTPGVDLEDYQDDTMSAPGVDPTVPGQATDMTATGQQGLVATPGQVAAYGANPGQKAKA